MKTCWDQRWKKEMYLSYSTYTACMAQQKKKKKTFWDYYYDPELLITGCTILNKAQHLDLTKLDMHVRPHKHFSLTRTMIHPFVRISIKKKVKQPFSHERKKKRTPTKTMPMLSAILSMIHYAIAIPSMIHYVIAIPSTIHYAILHNKRT